MNDTKIKLNLKWVSDVIGEDYLKWKPGDSISIDAQTGTGKTFFIVNKLFKNLYCYEKAIYICNRIELKRQIKLDLCRMYKIDLKEYCKTDEEGNLILDKSTNKAIFDLNKIDDMYRIKNIIITSYHSLSFNNLKNVFLGEQELDLDQYKYIIMDECQFFMIDADFNNKTLFAFNKLVNTHYHSSIKIFISATMEEMNAPIKNNLQMIKDKGFGEIKNIKLIKYTTGIDYNYLNLKYFKKDKDIIKTIRNDKTDKKWIIFISSIEKGKVIKKELDDSNISNSLITANISNKDKESITINSKFKSKVVITTKCLDNGINIKDDEVEHIVIDAPNKITFMQELGRIRVNIEKAREINVYLPTKSRMTFLNRINKIYKPKFEAIELYNTDKEKFKLKYNTNLEDVPQDLFYLDYNNEWECNPLGYVRLLKDNAFAENMAIRMKKDKLAFVKEQLNWLDLSNKIEQIECIEMVALEKEVMNLEEWLKNLYENDIRLLKSDFIEQIEEIIKNKTGNTLEEILNKLDYGKSRKKGMQKYNELFKILEFQYIVSSKPDKRRKLSDGSINPNRDKAVYIVGKDDN